MPLKISRILHAGYIFESDHSKIAFDPIFENPFSHNAYAFPSVEFDLDSIRNLKFDAVFISHFHDDHCSMDSLNLLDRDTPIYMFCVFAEMFEMIRELGFKNVYSLELNKPVVVGSIEIIPRKALDEDVDSIFQIQSAGLKILNVVDSWIDPETLSLLANQSPWDLVLWPFQIMRELEVIAPDRASNQIEIPEEWREQLQILNPRFVVPSSCQFQMEEWSWYNHAFFPISYMRFHDYISDVLPKAEVIRLDPGISIELDKSGIKQVLSLPWMRSLEENNQVEYQFSPQPQTTAEIAMHFHEMDFQQQQLVVDYCKHGLIEKFNSLEPSEDPYFNQTRLWRLTLYNHKGEPSHFHYQLENGHLMRTRSQEKPDWITEVPMIKVYSALTQGESLTSMYVRIQKAQFEDLVEDPLIRSLFTGEFGSYQKAQLKRLIGPI